MSGAELPAAVAVADGEPLLTVGAATDGAGETWTFEGAAFALLVHKEVLSHDAFSRCRRRCSPTRRRGAARTGDATIDGALCSTDERSR